MIGLTSISFRELDYKEIIDLCERNSVDVIEWGGDVHVPSGDLGRAKKIGEATRDKGIKTLSYGSYYRLSENKDIKKSFAQILDTAETLGAELIRIWAGGTKRKDLNKECEDNIRELKIICQMAAERNMRIGLEYHRGTLTETKEMTLKILKGVKMENLFTYWQMNPDISHEERLDEIKLLKRYICAVHVFYWIKDENKDRRVPLWKGRQDWQAYWELLKAYKCPMILEFVKDNEIGQLEEDAKELAFLMG